MHNHSHKRNPPDAGCDDSEYTAGSGTFVPDGEKKCYNMQDQHDD